MAYLLPAELTSSPLHTTEGASFTIHAIRDVTDRRKAEEEIRRLNAGLEQKVLERTAELTQSNEELHQFVYVASHDLKEPLRTVATFSELLAERVGDKLDPAAGQFLTYIIGGVKRMHDLIDDLLSYSTFEAAPKFALCLWT